MGSDKLSLTTDSNFQHYTIDKGEIKLREGEGQSFNNSKAILSKRTKQMSHSSRTLLAGTSTAKNLRIPSIKKLILDQKHENSLGIDVQNRTEKHSRMPLNQRPTKSRHSKNHSHSQTIDKKVENNKEQKKISNEKLNQKLSIEFKDKKSGLVQRNDFDRPNSPKVLK